MSMRFIKMTYYLSYYTPYVRENLGSEKGIRTLVPLAGRTPFQGGRLDQLSHLTIKTTG